MSSNFKDLLQLDLEPANSNLVLQQDDELPKIKRVNYDELTYSNFCWQHMHLNVPLIVENVCNSWKCCQDWLVQHDNNTDSLGNQRRPSALNFNNMKQQIADHAVPVADCNSQYFDSHAKTQMSFHQFLEQWKRQEEGDAKVNQNTYKNNNFYLKDWHLQSIVPDYQFYIVPKHFASDWLNEYLLNTNSGDDYRFVYMGPAGTWTPFHADVYGSYSWSTNITGCKKWLLLPPGEEQKLPAGAQSVVFDERLLDQYKIRCYVIRQLQNEAIFVPSGWHHQVLNETSTISINHNWFNCFNIEYIWQCLQDNMGRVVNELSDICECDNFWEQCQILLGANYGLTYLDFLKNLKFIAKRRVAALRADDTDNIVLFQRYRLNRFHMEYDLRCLKKLLSIIAQDGAMHKNREFAELYREILQIILQAEIVWDF